MDGKSVSDHCDECNKESSSEVIQSQHGANEKRKIILWKASNSFEKIILPANRKHDFKRPELLNFGNGFFLEKLSERLVIPRHTTYWLKITYSTRTKVLRMVNGGIFRNESLLEAIHCSHSKPKLYTDEVKKNKKQTLLLVIKYTWSFWKNREWLKYSF